jgi:membrane-associated PAP2 superfamily phosphatase
MPILMWLFACIAIGTVAMMLVTILLMATGAPFIGNWAMVLGWLVCVGAVMGIFQATVDCEDRWM